MMRAESSLVLDHLRQLRGRRVHQCQQCRQTIDGLPPQAVLVHLGLRVEHRGDDRGLGADRGTEANIVLRVSVPLQDLLGLVERLVCYALKLSGGIEYAISAA